MFKAFTLIIIILGLYEHLRSSNDLHSNSWIPNMLFWLNHCAALSIETKNWFTLVEWCLKKKIEKINLQRIKKSTNWRKFSKNKCKLIKINQQMENVNHVEQNIPKKKPTWFSRINRNVMKLFGGSRASSLKNEKP